MQLMSRDIRDYPILVQIMHFLLNVAYTGSIMLVVGVTVERYWAVCWPFKAKNVCTVGKAKAAVFFIEVIAIVTNIPKIFEVRKAFVDILH